MNKQIRGSTSDISGWVGWVIFASFWLGVAAVFQIIAGLTAIFQEGVFLVHENQLVFLDYQQWGWTHLVLGLIMLPAALALARGRLWGRIFGVFAATLSMLANFMFIEAYPFWSVLVILVDAFVIYAIIMHGDELQGV
jgi:hypothetical protein